MPSSGWAFNLRQAAIDPDSDSDIDAPEAPTIEEQVQRELDLSAREDHANFKSTPWTIAKANAVSRPAAAPDTVAVAADRSDCTAPKPAPIATKPNRTIQFPVVKKTRSTKKTIKPALYQPPVKAQEFAPRPYPLLAEDASYITKLETISRSLSVEPPSDESTLPGLFPPQDNSSRDSDPAVMNSPRASNQAPIQLPFLPLSPRPAPGPATVPLARFSPDSLTIGLDIGRVSSAGLPFTAPISRTPNTGPAPFLSFQQLLSPVPPCHHVVPEVGSAADSTPSCAPELPYDASPKMPTALHPSRTPRLQRVQNSPPSKFISRPFVSPLVNSVDRHDYSEPPTLSSETSRLPQAFPMVHQTATRKRGTDFLRSNVQSHVTMPPPPPHIPPLSSSDPHSSLAGIYPFDEDDDSLGPITLVRASVFSNARAPAPSRTYKRGAEFLPSPPPVRSRRHATVPNQRRQEDQRVHPSPLSPVRTFTRGVDFLGPSSPVFRPPPTESSPLPVKPSAYRNTAFYTNSDSEWSTLPARKKPRTAEKPAIRTTGKLRLPLALSSLLPLAQAPAASESPSYLPPPPPRKQRAPASPKWKLMRAPAEDVAAFGMAHSSSSPPRPYPSDGLTLDSDGADTLSNSASSCTVSTGRPTHARAHENEVGIDMGHIERCYPDLREQLAKQRREYVGLRAVLARVESSAAT